MGYVIIALLIAGGLLAASSLILSKKPEAKEMLNTLVPFQAGIGVALLVFGVLNLLRMLGSMMHFFQQAPLYGLAMYGSFFVAILLGFFFGMPLIAKLIPGDSPAEQKASEMAKKVAPFQTILGVLAIGLALLFLVFNLGLISRNP
jgi:hypothetical protein